jgi:hypothetical protein
VVRVPLLPPTISDQPAVNCRPVSPERQHHGVYPRGRMLVPRRPDCTDLVKLVPCTIRRPGNGCNYSCRDSLPPAPAPLGAGTAGWRPGLQRRVPAARGSLQLQGRGGLRYGAGRRPG